MGPEEMAEEHPLAPHEVHEPPGRYKPVRHYTDLEVWCVAMDVADAVYEVSASFPKDESFGLTSQVRRAAVSIPSNIAEGWGRGRTKEYVQFLRYARGSLYEVETQLRIAARRGYLPDARLDTILDQTTSIGRMLVGLIRALR